MSQQTAELEKLKKEFSLLIFGIIDSQHKKGHKINEEKIVKISINFINGFLKKLGNPTYEFKLNGRNYDK